MRQFSDNFVNFLKGSTVKYFLAMDAGGTKVASVIFDEELKIHSQISFEGGLNAKTLSPDVLHGNIKNALLQVKDASCGKKIEKIFGYFMHNEALIEHYGAEILGCSQVVEISEGALGILCGGIYPDGALLLSGTGSDVFVIKNGKTEDIVGGWGAILGDEGSGFGIGKAAINSAIAYHEGRGEYTVLYDMIKEKYPAESFRQSVYGIYRAPETARAVADFSYETEKAAELGDKTALEIFENTARYLSDTVIAAYKKNGLKNSFPLTFSGGVLKHDLAREKPFLFKKIKNILSEHDITNLHIPKVPPVYGAILYYAYSMGMDVSGESIDKYFPNV